MFDQVMIGDVDETTPAGADSSRVVVHVVHQHTAPVFGGRRADAASPPAPAASQKTFLEEAGDRLASAVRASLAELQPFDQIGVGECCIEFQLFAQQLLPGQFLAVGACCDNAPGYVCPERAYSEGGYEPGASRVAPQSEHLLKAAIRQSLGAPGR